MNKPEFKYNCGIYMIINLINGMKYVGSSNDINRRFNCHSSCLKRNKHYNKRLQRTWNKYGDTNFEFRLLEECIEEVLEQREIVWIKQYNTMDNRFGYNVMHPDRRNIGKYWTGRHHTNKSKVKQRNAKLGKPSNISEHGKKIIRDLVIAYNKQRILTPTQRENMSMGVKAYYKNNPSARERISRMNKGRKHSDASKEKMHLNRAGKPQPWHRKEIIRSDGKVYGSISEAGKDLGKCMQAISLCLKGTNKTCGGYKFEYVNKEIV